MAKSNVKYYAVAVGRSSGIYLTWNDCLTQTKGFSGAVFKSFTTKEEAEEFISRHKSGSTTNKKSTSILGGNSSNNPTNTSTSSTAIATNSKSNTISKSKKFYAVAKGIEPGIYTTWEECQSKVKGFSCPVFKSFTSHADASEFINNYNQNQSKQSNNDGNNNSFNEPTSKKARVNDQDSNMDRNNQLEENQLLARKSDPQLLIDMYFDGGSRGNPGLSGSGSYVVVKRRRILLMDAKSDLGTKPDKNNHNIHTCSSSSSSEISNETTIIKIRHYCGPRNTNNVAEYTGLLKGLQCIEEEVKRYLHQYSSQPAKEHLARSNQRRNIEINVKGDSKLIMDQLNGYASCKDINLKKLYNECTDIVKRIKGSIQNDPLTCVQISYNHVYREQNKTADGLANEAMDSQNSWTTSETLDMNNSNDEKFHV